LKTVEHREVLRGFESLSLRQQQLKDGTELNQGKRYKILAWVIIAAGVVVLLSTFLIWANSGPNEGDMTLVSHSPTGLDFMLKGGSYGYGNPFYVEANDVFILSGFWSLVFGGIIVLLGILVLRGRRSLCLWVTGVSLVALTLAIINIFMTLRWNAFVYSFGGNQTTEGWGPGIGLFLLLSASIVALVTGTIIFVLNRREGPAME
jgi:hypothetical protein